MSCGTSPNPPCPVFSASPNVIVPASRRTRPAARPPGYNPAMRLILASNSPRRRELLSLLGLEFTIAPGPDLDEAAVLAETDAALNERLMRLAFLKGESAARAGPEALVLSADTAVVVDSAVLGKPKDSAEAREMLGRLSGRAHYVITAVAVRSMQLGVYKAECESTLVTFSNLSAATIESYIERARPYDYAGAYAIQGLGALLVQRIEGDYSNVVGLPLGLTARLLEGAGVKVL